MKKFTLTILSVSAFFVLIGAFIQKVSAIFKLDDKALIILKKSRTAVGGETKIKLIKSLSANGKAVSIFQIDGTEKSREGKFEMNLMLPNQMSKMIEMRVEDRNFKKNTPENLKEERVIIDSDSDNLKTKFDSGDENSTDFKRTIEKSEIKERINTNLLRTVFSLFFTAPDNLNVSYFYDGEDKIDGTMAEIVECKLENNSIAKLYLNKSTNLPLMMSYQDLATPEIVQINEASIDSKDVIITNRARSDEKTADYTVKFSDYRDVNGLLLPFHWVQTADGKIDQTVTMEKYEINPSNIQDKFKPQEIRIRTRNP